MASAGMNPAGVGGGQPQGGQPGQPGGGPSQGDQQLAQVMEKFRPLAETVRQLGTQFPEGQEEAVQIMKALQAWMTKVSGNPQRNPESQAPPNA